MLLAPKRTARVGRPHTDLRYWQAKNHGDDALHLKRVLGRCPHHHAAVLWRGDERMRLDGEVRDHWKLVDVVDDEARLRGVHIPPPEMQLVEHVGVAPRAARSHLSF